MLDYRCMLGNLLKAEKHFKSKYGKKMQKTKLKDLLANV